nr:hypothetical protein Q903MT_gene5047 [Picea sitchensis]
MHSLSGALSIPSGERPRRAHTLRINGNDALYRSRTATSRLGWGSKVDHPLYLIYVLTTEPSYQAERKELYWRALNHPLFIEILSFTCLPGK